MGTVDPWQAHVKAINTNELRVEGASGNRTITGITATIDVAKVGLCDLCIIATKASQVGAAASEATCITGPDTLVLTIQNGLGAGDRIAEHMATKNVLLGVADGFGASMKAPGHAHHNAMKLIRIVELNGGLSDRLKTLEAQLMSAGFHAKAFADITQLIWEKFLCNVTFSAPCTAFDQTVGQLMAYVTGFGASMPNARPSMLLDHMAKRVSELDAINGMVPIMGRQDGFDTPYNDTLVAVLKSRKATFSGDRR